MKLLALLLLTPLLLLQTGCFGVSSGTRALRDAALENGVQGEQRFALGVGLLTLGAAKLGAHFADLPPEVKSALASVDGAEVSICDVRSGRRDFAAVLAAADRAMDQHGAMRIAGVIHQGQLVAVYLPKQARSASNLELSVLVLSRKQLVCVAAHGDVRELLQLALDKVREQEQASSGGPGTEGV